MENLLPLKICVAAGLIAIPLLPVLYLVARRMGGWDAPTGVHQIEHHLDMVRSGRGALIDPGWRTGTQTQIGGQDDNRQRGRVSPPLAGRK